MNSTPLDSAPSRASFLSGAALLLAASTVVACADGVDRVSQIAPAGNEAGGTSGAGGSSVTTGAGPGGSGGTTVATTGAGRHPPEWVLSWSDEFNGADGSPIDATRWTADVGGDGWGNQELEFYTDDTVNARQEGGSLVITATVEGAAARSCWYGPCQYTSARVQTRAKFEQAYGRVEARIQVARGKGLWSAFWLLGADVDAGDWPQCGEIDIAESIGRDPGVVYGSLNGPGYSSDHPLSGWYTLPDGANLADDFHLVAVEWERDTIRFYIDAALHETRTAADVPAGATWVYDHPFFVLLNLAVGGGWPGVPDATTPFPQSMKVDYVRAYVRP